MGVVYKARQKSLKRIVALKLLAPERADDPAFAARFEIEAQALAALNHPHIVSIYDFGHSHGFYSLIMEFVDGVNLRQAMKTGQLTPEQALAIVPPICEALQYAHMHGIVHRDIKPENLLLDREGRVKIADFGLAKMLDIHSDLADDHESQPAGTPQYMAPEQTTQRMTDHRVDIYSLGVVLYEMLTGKLPETMPEAPSRKVRVDIKIDEIVLRALKSKPELRYQTAQEFGNEVETLVNMKGSAEEPVKPIEAVEPGNRATWIPEQLPLVKQIQQNMTQTEKHESFARVLLFALWNAGTCFSPLFCIILIPSPQSWIIASCCLAVGVYFHPFIQRLVGDSLCNTQWASQRGITMQHLRELERLRNPGRKRQWKTMARVHTIGGGLALAVGLVVTAVYASSGAVFAASISLCVAAFAGWSLSAWPKFFRFRDTGEGKENLQLLAVRGLVFPLLLMSVAIVWLVNAGAEHLIAHYAQTVTNSALEIPRRVYIVTDVANHLSARPDNAIVVGWFISVLFDVFLIRTIWRRLFGVRDLPRTEGVENA